MCHVAAGIFAMAGPEFFQRFAYHRKGGTMVINGTTERCIEEKIQSFSPNKAHQLTTIIETPDPTPKGKLKLEIMGINRTRSKEENGGENDHDFTPIGAHQLSTIPETPHLTEENKKIPRRKRRACILSSSEDEVDALCSIDTTPRKSATLFSGLPFSKRLKSGDDSSRNGILPEQKLQLGSKTSASHDVQGGNSFSNSCRRLFHVGQEGEEGGGWMGGPERSRAQEKDCVGSSGAGMQLQG